MKNQNFAFFIQVQIGKKLFIPYITVDFDEKILDKIYPKIKDKINSSLIGEVDDLRNLTEVIDGRIFKNLNI